MPVGHCWPEGQQPLVEQNSPLAQQPPGALRQQDSPLPQQVEGPPKSHPTSPLWQQTLLLQFAEQHPPPASHSWPSGMHWAIAMRGDAEPRTTSAAMTSGPQGKPVRDLIESSFDSGRAFALGDHSEMP